MPYRIEAQKDPIEVKVWGQTSYFEILNALRELREIDPRKERCDLWEISEDSLIPYQAFPTISETLRGFITPETVGRKSAVVVPGGTQKAMIELYKSQSRDLPYEIGVFVSRGEAIAWLES
jgi:hypothetical protein